MENERGKKSVIKNQTKTEQNLRNKTKRKIRAYQRFA